MKLQWRVSSLSFLPTAKRYLGTEDDNSLLFFFSHCLIQLNSKAIPSLKHTEHLTLAILHIIEHNKDYKSCLIHYHLIMFTPFFKVCNSFEGIITPGSSK